MSELSYRERITEKSPEVYTKSSNGHNRIKMFMEPLGEAAMKLIREGEIRSEQDPKDRGKVLHDKAGWDPREGRRIWDVYNESVFVDGTRGLQRLDRIDDSACKAFREWLNAGPICKEPVIGIKVTFTDATVHVDPAHTGYNEIASMVFSGLLLCFLNAKPHLFEPIQKTGNEQFVGFQRVPEQDEENIILKIRQKKGIQLIMPSLTDESLGYYHGTKLVVSNCKVMEELEWMLVKPIPLNPAIEIRWLTENPIPPNPVLKIKRESFGFTARNCWVLTLSLFGQGISALPETLDHLYNLENLVLDFNHLEKLPDSITKLPWLQVLTLHSNWLTSLPQDFGNLNSLKYMDLSGNRLEALPPSVGGLSHLEVLNLNHNPLSSLPPELSRLSSLATLYIDEKFGNDPIIQKLGKKARVYAGTNAGTEKIKDSNYVQGQLEGIKLREKLREAIREAMIKKSIKAVTRRAGDLKQMTCEVCNVSIDINNLKCPVCGQLYCPYCGARMNMEAPGKCPRCGGIPNYTPAPLVVSTVDDIPPEDRFWESLPECPKCKAAVQPDWDECPFCGTKLR